MKAHSYATTYEFSPKNQVNAFLGRDRKTVTVELDVGDTLSIIVQSYVHSTIPKSTMGIGISKKYSLKPYVKKKRNIDDDTKPMKHNKKRKH